MTCEDCIHSEVCKYRNRPLPLCDCTYDESGNVERIGCPFTDKARFIELPCNIGDNIYYPECVFNKEIRQLEVKIKRTQINSIEIDKYNELYHCQNEKLFLGRNIGRDIFLSKKEAEKAVEERGSND